MAFNYWQKFAENRVYHIYNRSVSGRDLFRNEADYMFFLTRIKDYLIPHLNIRAYCLMPNHFHLLAEVAPINLPKIQKEKTSAAKQVTAENSASYNTFLEDQMRRLFSSFALKYKRTEPFHGALFQTRFKRVEVLINSTFLHKFAYIHHNPIHHGYTKNYSDWTYSSYNTYLSTAKTLLKKEQLLHWLGDGDMELGLQIFLDFHTDYKLEAGDNWQIDDMI